MKTLQNKLGITINSPAVLGFTFLAAAVHILSILTDGESNVYLFCVYDAPLTDPLTYLRLFLHVLGHADWDHLLSNLMYLLILGPMLEEKYGTKQIIKVMVMTAFVTGCMQMLLFNDGLLGASGIVFAFILLASITSAKNGSKEGIPLTFILVAVIYIGQQIYDGMFSADNVSNTAHIVGGAVGSVVGFKLNMKKGNSSRYRK